LGSPVTRVWTSHQRIIFELENGKYYTNPAASAGSSWSTAVTATSGTPNYANYVEMDYLTPGSVANFVYSSNYYQSFIQFKDGTCKGTGIYMSNGQLGLTVQTVTMADELEAGFTNAVDIVDDGEGLLVLHANGDLYKTGRGADGSSSNSVTHKKLTIIRQNVKKILGAKGRRDYSGFFIEDNDGNVWSAGHYWNSYYHNGYGNDGTWHNHGKLGLTSVSISTGQYYEDHGTTGVTHDGRVVSIGKNSFWTQSGMVGDSSYYVTAFASPTNPLSDYWYDTVTSYNVGSVVSAATGGEIDTSALETVNSIEIGGYEPTGTSLKFSFSFDNRVTWTTPKTIVEVSTEDWSLHTLSSVMDVKIDMVANIEDATPRVSYIIVKGAMKGIWAQTLVSPEHYLVHAEIDNPSTVVVTATHTTASKIVTIDIEE
jgi:hypothetical protein